MTLLPIVQRELQVAAHRPNTYRMRFFLVLGVLGLGLLLLLFGRTSVLAAQQGQTIFRAIGIMAFGFCLLAGPFFTADCLSEEKREGTLGLLFLTDLKGYDVVFGKLIATSLHAFYGLLAVLPVLGLPLLIGSVEFTEFLRVALALATTLFLSLSIGMFVSAMWLESRQNMTLTLLFLFLLAGIPFALGLGQRGGPWGGFSPSPVYLFLVSLDVHFIAPIFWRSLFTVFTIASAALIFPSFYAPRAWRDDSPPARTEPETERVAQFRFGSPAYRQSCRRRLDVNPFYWLAARDRLPQWTSLAILGPALALWACFFAAAVLNRGTAAGGFCIWGSLLTAYGMHQGLKYLVAVEAARRPCEDRRNGALEPVLVAPISEDHYISGHRRALVSLFLVPALLAFVTNLGLFWLIPFSGDLREAFFIFLVSVSGAGLLLLDLHALSLLGMWLAVRGGRHRRAVYSALARVMLGPWLAVAFLVLIRGLGHNVASETIICWFGVCALIDLGLANWSRDSLIANLRDHNPADSPAPESQAPFAEPPPSSTVGEPESSISPP